MTTYKTGNPIGSTSPKDLYDNAENLDLAVNDTVKASWIDRLGRPRRTLNGALLAVDATVANANAQIENVTRNANTQIVTTANNANAIIASLGYQVPVEYEEGIELTLANQTVSYDGDTYAPIASALPFTTSGTFEADKFRLIQGVSGADLASPYGAAMVGFIQPHDGAVTRTLFQKAQEIVNAKDFGAIGDGSTDDTEALEAFAVAVEGRIGHIPEGTYLSRAGLRLPSNCDVSGAGIDKTIIKLADDADITTHGLTNRNNTGSELTNIGNSFIAIRDLTVDGNAWRDAPGSGTLGSSVCFSSTSHLTLERVKGMRGVLHCIDIMNARYSTTTYAGLPSEHVTLTDCIGIDPRYDDAITTHYSGHITLNNPVSIRSGNYPLNSTNQHGLEIDDGSYDVRVNGGYSKGYSTGFQAKGHREVPSAHRVVVNGYVAEENRVNFNIEHGADPVDDTAEGVTLNDCVSIRPVTLTELPDFPATRGLIIRSFSGVTVRNFTLIGSPEDTTDSISNYIQIYGGATNVEIDGVTMKDINRPSGAIDIQATVGDSIRIRRIRARDCYGNIVRCVGSAQQVIIDDVAAELNDVSNPIKGVVFLGVGASMSENVQVANVRGNAGYQSAIETNEAASVNVPKAANIIFGTGADYWNRATLSGAPNLLVSVGWANGNQNLPSGEAVGYGFKASLRASGTHPVATVYTVSHIASVKESEEDANTSFGLDLATRRSTDVGVGATARWRLTSLGVLRPSIDNAYALGAASSRVSEIFSASGTINTSDERLKQQIKPIDEAAVRAWGKVNYCQYKFNDAIDEKGDGARWHFGLIAQQVKEAFESEGLDAFEYGLLCYDEWEQQGAPIIDWDDEFDGDGNLIRAAGQRINSEYRAAGSRYGIRYEEALVLECAYLRSRMA